MILAVHEAAQNIYSGGVCALAWARSALRVTTLWLVCVTSLALKSPSFFLFWMMKIVIPFLPPWMRLCTSIVKTVRKLKKTVLTFPQQNRLYLVIQNGKTRPAVMDYTKLERVAQKVSQVAALVTSGSKLIMCFRNSQFVQLGQRAVARVSWIANVSGSIASLYILTAESRFLYTKATASEHKIWKRQKEPAFLAKKEIAASIMTIAIHIASLTLSLAIFLPLTPSVLQTVRLWAFASMSLSMLVSCCWKEFIIGSRQQYVAT